MGLWSKGIQRSRAGLPIKEDTLETEDTSVVSGESAAKSTKNTEIASEMPEDEGIDWEERHFQICLALLANPNVYKSQSDTGSVIRKADYFLEQLLKERMK